MSNLFWVYVFVAVAIVAVVASAMARAGVPERYFANDEEKSQKFRLAMFVIWTLILPLGLLVEWNHRAAAPPSTEMAAFAYGRKVVTDLWTAVAVVLALLWGIKK
jgi:hypothetical protein